MLQTRRTGKAMGKAKTYFEQVPVHVAKELINDFSAPEYRLLCAICDSPVELERCKTNEHGHAVHDDCYVTRMAPRPKRFPQRPML